MKPATSIFLLCVVTALPAEAQIYTWRDDSGTLVISNRPQPSGQSSLATYEVPGTRSLRSTTAIAPAAARRYETLIRQHAAAHGVSPDLVRAVIQAESAFNPWAISPKGAMGLMQLMPATAQELGVDDPFDPAQNIRGGVAYLARLLERYDNDVALALAAYNAGPGAVDRYGQAVPPFRETQAYVSKITRRIGTGDSRRPAHAIYKWTEIVDGRPVVRYSNIPPQGVSYEVVGRR